MATPKSILKTTAWSNVALGVVLATAHYVWFSINGDKLGKPGVDSAYVALTALVIMGWLLIVVCGVRCLMTGRPPGRGLAGITAATATAAAVTALTLLAVTASGDYGDEAFDDVLLQSWPLPVLLLFAGDWVYRARAASRLGANIH